MKVEGNGATPFPLALIPKLSVDFLEMPCGRYRHCTAVDEREDGHPSRHRQVEPCVTVRQIVQALISH